MEIQAYLGTNSAVRAIPLRDALLRSRGTSIFNIDLREQRASSPDVDCSSPQRLLQIWTGETGLNDWRAPCAGTHAIDPSASPSSVQRMRWH
jgi:hypothetical protein